MDKLTLMHELNLSQESSIHLLISGIVSRSLRETAAALNVEAVDSFLDSMHRITSVTMDTDKRLAPEAKSTKGKEPTYRKVGKPAQATPTNQKDETGPCGFCKIPGHTYESCYKRQRKERWQATTTATPAVPVNQSQSTTVSAVEVAKEENTIAHIHQGRNIRISNLRKG